MSKTVFHCNSQEAKQQILENAISLDTNGAVEVTFRRLPKTRTSKQNRALHKYLGLVAEALNSAGWDFWCVMLRKTGKFISKQRTQIESLEELTDYDKGYLDALNDVWDTLPKSATPWNTDTVKEHMWRPVQVNVIDKESTTEADRVEYGPVYDVLNRHLGEKFGVHVTWPEREK